MWPFSFLPGKLTKIHFFCYYACSVSLKKIFVFPMFCFILFYSVLFYSVLFCSIFCMLSSAPLPQHTSHQQLLPQTSYGVYWQVRFWSHNLASYLSTYTWCLFQLWLDSGSYDDKVRCLAWVCLFVCYFGGGAGVTHRDLVQCKVSSSVWIAGTWTATGRHDLLKHLHEFSARQLTQVLMTRKEGDQVLMPLVGCSDTSAVQLSKKWNLNQMVSFFIWSS